MNTGLDPEALVLNRGFIVPASNFLPPPMETEHGGLNELSYDNAAVEMRPRHNNRITGLTENLRALFHAAIVELGMAKRQGYVPTTSYISLSPAAPLTEWDRDLDSVKEFGCSPSFILNDRYSQQQVRPLQGAADTRMRSAGFHIHQELAFPGTTQPVVAILDGLLGLADVIMNHRLDFTEQSQVRREEIGYGRAGEFRTRRSVHGVPILEYRVLGPWPLATPEIAAWAISVIRKVCQYDSRTLMGVLSAFPKRPHITQAINESDVSKAQALYAACSSVWTEHMGGVNAIKHSDLPDVSGIGRLSTRWSA